MTNIYFQHVRWEHVKNGLSHNDLELSLFFRLIIHLFTCSMKSFISANSIIRCTPLYAQCLPRTGPDTLLTIETTRYLAREHVDYPLAATAI